MGTTHPILYGLSVKYIAETCKVTLKTAQRWKSGQYVPPHSALMVLSGHLGMFSDAWRGWHVRGEMLISPEGWEMPVDEVRAIPMLRAQLAAYQDENRALRRNRDAIEIPEEQPLPGSWEISYERSSG